MLLLLSEREAEQRTLPEESRRGVQRMLPGATMALALMYECVRGTGRSIALSMVLAVLIMLGMMCEVAGSQWGWFADFTDRALAWDLMPWLGDTTFGNIHEELIEL